MTIRNRTQSRLARIAIGNLGEYKILTDSINELDFIKSKFFQIIVYNSLYSLFYRVCHAKRTLLVLTKIFYVF